jgi:hypothetical protein
MIHRYDTNKMIVYLIRNKLNHAEFYIGCYLKPLGSVISIHRCNTREPKRTSKLYLKMREIGFDNFEYSIIDVCANGNKDELRNMTIRYIRDMKPTLNNQDYTFDKNQHSKEYRAERKEHNAELHARWVERNPDYYQEYRDANADRIKEYREANKDRINQLQRGYRQYNIFAKQLRNISIY